MSALGFHKVRTRLRTHHRDAGFTLTEMVVILALAGIVGTIALTITLSVFRTQRTVTSRSEAQQQMQLAVDQVASEIRNADGVYNPATITKPGGWELVSYSTADSTTPTCTEWQYVSANGTLRSRSWPTNWSTTGNVTQWRTVATGLTNSTSPFTLADQTSAYTGKVVYLKLESDTGTGSVISIQSAATGRNITGAASAATCSDRPAP